MCGHLMTSQESIDVPALLTKKQTADYLGISTRSLDRIASAGTIKPVRVTKGTLRYRRNEIDTYVASLDHDDATERRGAAS